MRDVHSKYAHGQEPCMCQKVHALTVQTSASKVRGWSAMRAPIGMHAQARYAHASAMCTLTCAYAVHTPVAVCAFRCVFQVPDMSMLPTLYCRRGRSSGCWRIRAIWTTRDIGQSKQEGC